MTPRPLAALAVLVGIALAVAAAAWALGALTDAPVEGVPPRQESSAAPPPGTPGLPEDLARADVPVVAWAARTQARFEPCGCVAGMVGGLMRRASLLQRLPADRVLSLELGGWCAGGEAHERLRTAHYLEGLAAADLDAVGVGEAEVALGVETLRAHLAQARAAGLRVVCANVRAGDGGQLADRIAHVDAGGRRFAVTSLAPRGAAGAGLVVDDPADALAALAAATHAATLVVMADLDEQGLANLARAAPGVALVVGGAVSAPSQSPLAVGAARVVHAANHGKTLGWWRWGAPTCHFELLAEGIPESPVLRARLRRYQEALGSAPLGIDGDVGDAAVRDAAAWAGSRGCADCHPQAHAVHAESRHAHSFESLVRKGYQHDPDCLRCHVTGMGRPGGWIRGGGRDHLREVGCESCHGPSGAHAAAARAGDARRAPTTPAGLHACVTCHDAENSPRFDAQAYWQRILHGVP